MARIGNTSQLSRNEKIDYIKGFVIFLVVLGHSIQYYSVTDVSFFENSVTKVIYSFHMPMFMLISGYVYYYSMSRRSIMENSMTRLHDLGYLILVWGGLNWLVRFVVDMPDGGFSLKGFIEGFGAYWYLWSLLVISQLFLLMMALVKKSFYPLLIVINLMLVIFSPEKTMTLFTLPYFVIGYYMHYIRFDFNRFNRVIKVVALISYGVMIQFYKVEDYIYTSRIIPFGAEGGVVHQINVDLYRWAIGLLGSFAFFIVVDMCYTYLKSSRKWLVSLGKASLYVYLLQKILIEFLGKKLMQRYLLPRLPEAGLGLKLYNSLGVFSVALIGTFLIMGLVSLIKRHAFVAKLLFGVRGTAHKGLK